MRVLRTYPILIISGVLLLCGCFGNKRTIREIQKARPYLTLSVDTHVVVQSSVTSDTFFRLSSQSDTFFVSSTNTRVIHHYDSIFVTQVLPPCTTTYQIREVYSLPDSSASTDHKTPTVYKILLFLVVVLFVAAMFKRLVSP